MIGEVAEVSGPKPAERLLIVARDYQDERKQNTDQQNPEQAAGQGAHPYRAGTGRAFMASSRRGSSAMMRWRSPSASDIHCAISPSVRPQPRHSCERGSMVQTLVHGEAIGGIGSPVTIRRQDKAHRGEGNGNR